MQSIQFGSGVIAAVAVVSVCMAISAHAQDVTGRLTGSPTPAGATPTSTQPRSPTRAALITGRNHHPVGFGIIAELSTGFPGYDSIIGPENATIGKLTFNLGPSQLTQADDKAQAEALKAAEEAIKRED
jgi:hypothetical protein